MKILFIILIILTIILFGMLYSIKSNRTIDLSKIDVVSINYDEVSLETILRSELNNENGIKEIKNRISRCNDLMNDKTIFNKLKYTPSDSNDVNIYGCDEKYETTSYKVIDYYYLCILRICSRRSPGRIINIYIEPTHKLNLKSRLLRTNRRFS